MIRPAGRQLDNRAVLSRSRGGSDLLRPNGQHSLDMTIENS